MSEKLENDFVLKSELNGIVYSILKEKGEMIGPQTPLAIIGDANEFVLEMQVDENDIFRIKKGLPIYVTMDSYKDQVFEAIVAKINPLMNERSKTFLIEASFTKSPSKLYPNVTFEGNIVLQKKDKALLIPRNYLKNDSIVTLSNGDEVIVKTGLMDYRKVEILSGLKESDEIIEPVQ
jgi:multidrug efflux pump subunit AcrA (membrane-fusion protein)